MARPASNPLSAWRTTHEVNDRIKRRALRLQKDHRGAFWHRRQDSPALGGVRSTAGPGMARQASLFPTRRHRQIPFGYGEQKGNRMIAYCVLDQKNIPLADLFDGRLAKYGIEDAQSPTATARSRCLTDGGCNYLWCWADKAGV